MNSEKKYTISVHSAMEWARHELDAVGRIAAVKDTDIQYTYAMCTVNSMLHLRKALLDISENPNYSQDRASLLQRLDEVERVISHVIKDYGVDLNSIRAFNTRKIMGNIGKFNTNTTRRVNVTNAKPLGANAKPLGANGKPLGANGKPLGANAKPLGANGKPLGANAKPLGANGKPLGANGKAANSKGLLGFFGF